MNSLKKSWRGGKIKSEKNEPISVDFSSLYPNTMKVISTHSIEKIIRARKIKERKEKIEEIFGNEI